MKTKQRILLESKARKQEKLILDKEYFSRLARVETPNILWITSSDSRTSFREMINAEPGEMIVYRNIGFQIREDDPGFMALLEECLFEYKITHIVICGFSRCSAAKSVLHQWDTEQEYVRHWLKPIRDIYEKHRREFEGKNPQQQERLLIELNVRQQVLNVSKNVLVKKAWSESKYPVIHGLYFDLLNGELNDIYSLEKHTAQKVDAEAQPSDIK